MPRIATIKPRGGTAAQWTSANPILGAREMGIETDTQKSKYGDGVTAWTSLPYSVANASGTSTVDWSSILGKPTTFPPTSHTHTKSEITDFAHTHTVSQITDLVFPPSTVVSDTAPTGVPVGTKWFKSSTAQEYIYFDNAWIEI